jgi:hypothetical protein
MIAYCALATAIMSQTASWVTLAGSRLCHVKRHNVRDVIGG